MFRKVLIANRGEVAVRIMRACRSLGIPTVAVFSEVDRQALHVRLADEAICIGPADSGRSYLHVPAIISAAEVSRADAIHPGYGFLSENSHFASVVQRCGLTFIGPSPEAMKLWGDKVSAREAAERFGLPLLPGSGVLTSVSHALAEAEKVGYPVMLKARAGGGGRGMRIVRSSSELEPAYHAARSEAEKGFKNPELFLERFVEEPRHIEFQVLADGRGKVWLLGERECSLQRRNQKIVEEAPSPAMTPERRRTMSEVIRRAVAESGYASLGTLEFIQDEKGDMFFLEMNTRLQVEHPITEAITGVDLVEAQLRIAAGQEVDLPDFAEGNYLGHAVECRILAEDPKTFAPSPGLITEYHAPGGTGVRVDDGVYGGVTVPPNYDSLLAKLITFAPDRNGAFERMRRALGEYLIGGIRTNIEFHQKLLQVAAVREGRMSTRTVERVLRGEET